MSNKDFYEKMQKLLTDGSLVYGSQPEMYVRMKTDWYFVSATPDNADFLEEIKKKIETKQIFTNAQLIRTLGRSSNFLKGEVKRGKYIMFFANGYRLYIVKDW